MNYKKLIFCLCVVASVCACKKDTLKDSYSGTDHDRSITEIKFENQIGLTQIERTPEKAEIVFSYNLDATGSTQIKVTSLVTSVGATADVAEGDVLDFDNEDNTATITVTPKVGEPLEWKIIMKPFTEPLKGTWNLSKVIVFGGVDRGEWGGGQFKPMDDVMSTLFEGDNRPNNELDNKYTFEVTGYTDAGNSYGTIINDAGDDGLYGGYIYSAANQDSDGISWDCERIYRKIPVEGFWEHDNTLGVYYFRDSDNKLMATATFKTEAFTAQSILPQDGVYKYYDFEANTLVFDVEADAWDTNNWGKNYTTANIVVYCPLVLYMSLSNE